MEKIILPISQKIVKDSIVISSKITIYRNIDGLKFPEKSSRNEKMLIVNEIKKISENADFFSLVSNDITDIPHPQKENLLSDLIISNTFIKNNSFLYFTAKDGSIILLINEKAHLTFFSIEYSLKLKKRYHKIMEMVSSLEEYIHFAYHPDMGYLTSELSHTGNALSLSVLLNLSGLELLGKISELQKVCQESNYLLKPVIDNPNCKLFYLKTDTAFGISEDRQINHITEFINKLEELEIEARKELLHKKEDKEFITAYILQLKDKKILEYHDTLEFIALIDILHKSVYKILNKEHWYSQIFRLQNNSSEFQHINDIHEINQYRAKLLTQIFLNTVQSI